MTGLLITDAAPFGLADGQRHEHSSVRIGRRRTVDVSHGSTLDAPDTYGSTCSEPSAASPKASGTAPDPPPATTASR